MTDLFKATHCDRCKKELNKGRKMSWFTEETICIVCCSEEEKIKCSLDDSSKYEGCGYVPKIEGKD